MDLHAIEKRALVGDRYAVLVIISAFRRFRKSSEELLKLRYRDGECDAVDLTTFNFELQVIVEESIGQYEDWLGSQTKNLITAK